MRFSQETLEILGFKHNSTSHCYHGQHSGTVLGQILSRNVGEFKYLTGYQPITKAQESEFSGNYGVVLDREQFRYEYAIGEEKSMSEISNIKVKKKIDCLKVIEKETEMYFACDFGTKPLVHVLFVGLKDPQKPIGFYKMKKAMVRFRDWIENNNKDGAYGRSLASQYPTKLNKKRYPNQKGDWRKAKASIKAKDGKRSRALDKLGALYLRTGLWIVFPKENQAGEGLKIMMPTKTKFKQMWLDNPEWMEQVTKFSKHV